MKRTSHQYHLALLVFIGTLLPTGALAQTSYNLPWYENNRRRVMIPTTTTRWMKDPMSNFDAEEWAGQLEKAGVRDVIVSGRQSYGDAYYPTQYSHFVVDVIGPLTKSLHKRGMHIAIYFNMDDKELFDQHPKWQRGKGTGNLWPLDQTDPSYQQLTLNMLEEIAKSHEIDGIWFDLYYPGPEFMKKMRATMSKYRPNIALSMNSGYNSDPMMDGVDFVSTEGHEVRTCSRHAKILRRFGKPFELVIPENMGGWLNWRQRPTASHMVLAAILAANGGTPNFGGLVYPDGRLDQGYLDEMSKVWHWLKERESWFVGAQSWAEVGVVLPSECFTTWYPAPQGLDPALVDNHIPYDMVKPSADLSPYKVLILDEASKLEPWQAESIREYVKNGGKLLALYSGCQNLEDVLGIHIESTTLPPGYDAAYIAPAAEPIWNGVVQTPLVVSGNDSSYLTKLNGGEAIAMLMFPFDKVPQDPALFGVHAPSQDPTNYPAIVRHEYGKGEAIFVAAAVAREVESIQKTANYSAAYHKKLIANLIGLLGGDELVETDAPSQVEVNLARKDMKYLVHLTDCSAALGDRYSSEVSDLPRLVMNVSIPIDRLGSARRVRAVPENIDVAAIVRNGKLEWTAQVKLHAIYEIY